MSLLKLARRPSAMVPPDATIMDAIEEMVRHAAGAVAVTEGTRLVGIFTERDVMKKAVMEGRDPRRTRVSELMTTEVKSVTDETTVPDAITILSTNRIRHLPVVDQDKNVLGMISLRYLLQDRLEELLNELRALDNYISADGPGG